MVVWRDTTFFLSPLVQSKRLIRRKNGQIQGGRFRRVAGVVVVLQPLRPFFCFRQTGSEEASHIAAGCCGGRCMRTARTTVHRTAAAAAARKRTTRAVWNWPRFTGLDGSKQAVPEIAHRQVEVEGSSIQRKSSRQFVRSFLEVDGRKRKASCKHV